MAGRSLDDVFDYFISPEEQREARERTAPRPVGVEEEVHVPASAAVQRCALVADPTRPLLCSLAVDLARGLAGEGRARILSPGPRPSLLPMSDRLEWTELDASRHGAPGRPLQRTLESSADPALVVVPPAQLPSWATDLVHAAVHHVVIPVDPTAGGATRALALVRTVEPWANELEIGALVIGTRSADEGHAALRQLAGAARRQLDLDVTELGSLERDTACDRALLAGRTLLDFDQESNAARSLAAVCERLARGGVTPATSLPA